MDVVPGTTEDGADASQDDTAQRLLNTLRIGQEAVWAVLSQGRILVESRWEESPEPPGWPVENVTGCTIYIPTGFMEWWNVNSHECWSALHAAARSAWGVRWDDLLMDRLITVEPLLAVPPELIDFVAQNTGRPKPRRYNSTAVQYFERDGVAWLTMPEVKLYDALKETGWLFVPQPQFLASDTIDSRPDFLIFWKHRAQYSVLVEIDSDRFHSTPSIREHDEAKERRFESRSFQYLRFSAKEVLKDPIAVLQQITEYCSGRWGA